MKPLAAVSVLALALLCACSSSHTIPDDGGQPDGPEASAPSEDGAPPVRIGCDHEACVQLCCRDDHGEFCCHGNRRDGDSWTCVGGPPCINGEFCCTFEIDGGHCVSGGDFFSPKCQRHP